MKKLSSGQKENIEVVMWFIILIGALVGVVIIISNLISTCKHLKS